MSDRYQNLVEQARLLLGKRDLIRLEVAKLAIEACTIRHGGRSNGLYTLTDFSRDIGLSFKRLSEWVIVYKMVVSKIPEEIKTDDDWNKASKVYNSIVRNRSLLNKKEGKVKNKTARSQDIEMEKKEVLRRFKAIDENSQAIRYADEALNRALYNLNKIEFCPKDDVNFLLNINQNCSIFLEIAKKIQDRSIYLMGRIK